MEIVALHRGPAQYVQHRLGLKDPHLVYLAFNPLNAELNPICHLLAFLGAHHIFHVSWLRVN